MSVRKDTTTPHAPLDVKQRITLFYNTSLTNEQALGLEDTAINFDLLVRHGVTALNITTAGLRLLALKRRGVEEAAQLRRLGFDALHLVDPVLCADASAVYGAKAVIDTFLVAAQDAVALAGSDAVATLGLTNEELLGARAPARPSRRRLCSNSTPARPTRSPAFARRRCSTPGCARRSSRPWGTRSRAATRSSRLTATSWPSSGLRCERRSKRENECGAPF